MLDYQLCNGNIIFCSTDCQEVLILSQKNDYLDQKKESAFDEGITSDAYYDSHYDSHYDSDWSMNNPEECVEAFHSTVKMIEYMDNESMK